MKNFSTKPLLMNMPACLSKDAFTIYSRWFHGISVVERHLINCSLFQCRIICEDDRVRVNLKDHIESSRSLFHEPFSIIFKYTGGNQDRPHSG